ncbi:uncharacterized protein EI97DRAFT_431826 [Westerdykella ornata]|uniref:Uncharacterized protein n=1 Tax=Westerdykella ornata TaxID=318751 RepID=A0A6A6JNN1_WESOR|nr:uncharacterized protein EI97DRAFT_431826 [Westerdykella ornata]KAF2277743.1 hypothetical protein EI97DRAFT_431826 [Westerdykella ornata]
MHILILSLEGFSFSARQLYEHLLPDLLSKAIVHESTSIQDALFYINTRWPTAILVTDGVIASDSEDGRKLLSAVKNITRQGCTTVLAGFFTLSVFGERLTGFLRDNFDLRWEGDNDEPIVRTTALGSSDENLIVTSGLNRRFTPEAYFLRKVPKEQAVYVSIANGHTLAYAAIARIGLGKLGYVGEANFSEEAEALILAMCHLGHDVGFE